jgi:hypothetical protein
MIRAKILPYIRRRPLTQPDLEKLIPLAVYAKKYHYSLVGARDRIARRKIKAFKIARRVWVLDVESC